MNPVDQVDDIRCTSSCPGHPWTVRRGMRSIEHPDNDVVNPEIKSGDRSETANRSTQRPLAQNRLLERFQPIPETWWDVEGE